MTHRERIARIYAGQSVDRPGFWLGNPHPDLLAQCLPRFGVSGLEALRRTVDDDCRWLPTDMVAPYRHPAGKPVFEVMYAVVAPGSSQSEQVQAPRFAECTDPAEVERYTWPDAAYFDLDVLRAEASDVADCWRWSGGWGCFFHNVADYFGMETYFLKMYTDPEVVHAVTRRVVDFYLALNRRMFTECRDCLDAYFIGNDFGTQEDLLISPDNFAEFILPYYRELIAQAKSFGLPVQMHCCGAIRKLIPMLIDAGIDALHPLQALARGMDAESLAREFTGKIVFVGGVDTQELMWHGTPQQVKDEVRRLRDIFGDRWIISPSHEVLLPEVPVENVVALCEAATGVVVA